MPKCEKSLSLESALKKLDAVVQQLEGGQLSLDDSLKTFETGIQLTKQCRQILQDAEQKIKILTADGALETFQQDDE
jgi:exodeoxyribonuclease VII small subunit